MGDVFLHLQCSAHWTRMSVKTCLWRVRNDDRACIQYKAPMCVAQVYCIYGCSRYVAQAPVIFRQFIQEIKENFFYNNTQRSMRKSENIRKYIMCTPWWKFAHCVKGVNSDTGWFWIPTENLYGRLVLISESCNIGVALDISWPLNVSEVTPCHTTT